MRKARVYLNGCSRYGEMRDELLKNGIEQTAYGNDPDCYVPASYFKLFGTRIFKLRNSRIKTGKAYMDFEGKNEFNTEIFDKYDIVRRIKILG